MGWWVVSLFSQHYGMKGKSSTPLHGGTVGKISPSSWVPDNHTVYVPSIVYSSSKTQ